MLATVEVHRRFVVDTDHRTGLGSSLLCEAEEGSRYMGVATLTVRVRGGAIGIRSHTRRTGVWYPVAGLGALLLLTAVGSVLLEWLTRTEHGARELASSSGPRVDSCGEAFRLLPRSRPRRRSLPLDPRLRTVG